MILPLYLQISDIFSEKKFPNIILGINFYIWVQIYSITLILLEPPGKNSVLRLKIKIFEEEVPVQLMTIKLLYSLFGFPNFLIHVHIKAIIQ